MRLAHPRQSKGRGGPADPPLYMLHVNTQWGDIVAQSVAVLQASAQATKHLEWTTFPTISLVLPYVLCVSPATCYYYYYY
eukprot:scaffold133933_cov42-Tisochrysis_lutea.AAC.1